MNMRQGVVLFGAFMGGSLGWYYQDPARPIMWTILGILLGAWASSYVAELMEGRK